MSVLDGSWQYNDKFAGQNGKYRNYANQEELDASRANGSKFNIGEYGAAIGEVADLANKGIGNLYTKGRNAYDSDVLSTAYGDSSADPAFGRIGIRRKAREMQRGIMNNSFNSQAMNSEDMMNDLQNGSTFNYTNDVSGKTRGMSIWQSASNGAAQGAKYGSVGGPWGTLFGAIGGTVGGLASGIAGVVNGKKRLRSLQDAQRYANNRNQIGLTNSINNMEQKKLNEMYTNSLSCGGRLFSRKGRMFAEGGKISNKEQGIKGITEFNAGGSHEENPYGGVPQGIAEDGLPNLVEEGEVKISNITGEDNQYILSNRIVVDAKMADQFGIDKSVVGLTYAAAFKKLYNKYKERQGSQEVKNEIADLCNNFQNAQEAIKEIQDMQRRAAAMKSLTPEQRQMIEQEEQQAQQPSPEEQDQAMQDGIQQGLQEGGTEQMEQQQPMGQSPMEQPMQQGMPQDAMMQQTGQPMMSRGGRMFSRGGRMFAHRMDGNSGKSEVTIYGSDSYKPRPVQEKWGDIYNPATDSIYMPGDVTTYKSQRVSNTTPADNAGNAQAFWGMYDMMGVDRDKAISNARFAPVFGNIGEALSKDYRQSPAKYMDLYENTLRKSRMSYPGRARDVSFQRYNPTEEAARNRAMALNGIRNMQGVYGNRPGLAAGALSNLYQQGLNATSQANLQAQQLNNQIAMQEAAQNFQRLQAYNANKMQAAQQNSNMTFQQGNNMNNTLQSIDSYNKATGLGLRQNIYDNMGNVGIDAANRSRASLNTLFGTEITPDAAAAINKSRRGAQNFIRSYYGDWKRCRGGRLFARGGKMKRLFEE